MRVLLLNPPDLQGGLWMKEVGRCGRKAVGGEVWPQTGLAYLAATAEREGAQVRIVDAMADGSRVEDLEALCREWPPDLILASSATPTVHNDAEVLSRLHAVLPQALRGFVGPHASALPRETLEETGADVVLVDEAEETLAEIVRDPSAMRRAAGTVWRAADGAVTENPPRGVLADLDALPTPARRLLPNAAYRMPFFGDHPFATVIPSRGCPWPCTFCRAGRVWGRRVRLRSVEGVLKEIRDLERDFGIRRIVFMTDSLTLDRDWAAALCDGLATLEPRPLWICNSRVDVVDGPMLRRMRGAGCRMVSYGVESGDETILKGVRKGVTLEQSRRAIRLTKEAGLLSMAYFMLGLPGETRETVRRTERFAAEIDPDYVNFHVATPFPGTALYEEAVANGWLRSDDWRDFEEEGSAVMQAGELTPAELRRAQASAMRRFYLRPRRLARELARIRSWGDLRGRLRAGFRMLSTLGGDHAAQ